nr:YafY family protein [Micromonospora sp. DSM 115978]
MPDTPGRLLRLLSLLQTPREWSGGELADRLDVSLRTVRRDVSRLRDLGYPVRATMGAVGGYKLVAGAALPPLLLDDEEAVAIVIGLRATARQAVVGLDDASVRALAKLEQVLPAKLRRRVASIGAATVAMTAWERPTVDPDTLTALAAAITGRERLRFGYRSRRGAVDRLVEPHRLVSAGRRWYLVAYDNERADWRIFRVDRIDRIRATGVRVPPRDLPGGDAAAFVADTMRELAPTYRAVATLHAPVERVADRFGDEAGSLERIDERTCRLRGHTDTLPWLALRLLSLDCDVEVHEPPELVAHLRQLGARATRAAGVRP